MFRNSYDSDATTFSPQGRLHQVEYALEAVKQGSAAVGLRSDTHVVLLALKRSTGELASYQKKLIRIDDHIGIAIAGLTSDARVLSNFMRQQAMTERMLHARPIPVNRVVGSIADRAQVNTQQYGRRPYGVGFLVAGYDEAGPHLIEFTPSGTMLEYLAMSIGARSQSARTYLERHLSEFASCDAEGLIMHGLKALRETLQQDKDLTGDNTSVGVISPPPEARKDAEEDPSVLGLITKISIAQVPEWGTQKNFHILEGEDLKSYLQKLGPKETSESRNDAAAPVATEGEGEVKAEETAPGSMETD